MASVVSTHHFLKTIDMNWLERLTLAGYSCLVWAMQPLVRLKLRVRARKEPEYGVRVGTRFGRYDYAPEQGRVWVHAVSLGETRAAQILIAELRSLRPELKILLTHGTASGWITGRDVVRPGDRQEWFPWDTRQATERFVRQFRPSIGLMMETEVWPNMIHTCVRHGIPVILVNARKSESSLAVARRRRWLALPAYRALTAVLAQGAGDSARLKALGARVIAETGNIKFDARPAPNQLLQGKAWRRSSSRPVLMLASSRHGEEFAMLEALSSRRISGTMLRPLTCQVLIIPRHIQRVDELAAQIRNAGFSVSMRSQWCGAPQEADIWLGDTMGELTTYYAMSDVALLGGSYERFGGQNLIEAAAAGCPVIMGPHTYNFSEAAQWALSAGAARRASSMRDAVDQAFHWMARSDELTEARQRCLEFAGAHHGAANVTAQQILSYAGTVAVSPAVQPMQVADQMDLLLGDVAPTS